MKQSQQTIKVLIIAVIVAGLLGSLIVLALDSAGTEGLKIFGICLSLIFYGICGAICLVVGEKPAYKALGGAGMIVAALSFILTSVLILAEIGDPGFYQFVSCLVVVLIGLTHICLLHHFNLQNKYAAAARMIATIAISLFTLLSVIRVFDTFGGIESFLYSQSTYKITLVVFIVDLAATLLVPLCNRLDVYEKVEINFEETLPADQPEKQDPAV